ncbi:MAG TPA: hypothetical protein DCR44_04770 [Acholeplasmatales bacterium]|nr:hypothetical protein [Acholeplasmatales bacterium]
MKHQECRNEDIISIYRQYYQRIHGGIDGYYEKTILDSPIYEIYTNVTLAYFSVHPTRGLTSLVVLPEHNESYETIFSYVIGLPLFTHILFSEKDEQFVDQMKKNNIPYEIQAYNFEANQKSVSSLRMNAVKNKDLDRIRKEFGEFIEYNQISLENKRAFYYAQDDKMISFGALEPLRLNENRFCISMVVSEAYRKKGYGSETVKFLIEYLQSKNLECNARCYVHNEASRKTLIKSGLVISNVLYKAQKG